MESQTKFVPEENFSDVPESFSALSTIARAEKKDRTSGIILDSLKEVESALRVYNGEMGRSPRGSLGTTLDLMENTGKQAGLFGVGLTLLAGEKMQKGRDLVGTMIAEAKSHLASRGKYNKSYDYDGMGSNFFKTSVDVEKVEGKLVLCINAAYVGSEPEKSLAKQIDRPVVLRSAEIFLYMSVVDGWWYNIDLQKTFGEALPVRDEMWPEFAKEMAGRDNRPSIVLSDKGEEFAAVLGIENHHYRFKHGEGSRVLSRDYGTRVAGASWSAYRGSAEEALPEEKELNISIHSLGCGPFSAPIVSPEKMNAIRKVRDDIFLKIVGPLAKG